MKPAWNVEMGYEPQLGSIVFHPTCPHGNGRPEVAFRVPLQEMLRDFKVRPEALRALLAEAAAEPPPAGNLENLCRIAIPERLDGLTVLDVGGYDGRFAKLCLDRGAASAICLDSRQWEHYGWQETPQLPGVEYVQGDFRTWQEPVDVVLFFNVLYHVEDPWAALAHLRTITRQQMILASLTIWSDEPVFKLYAPRECNPEDDTVYWGPSESALLRLLSLTGWQAEKVGRAFERVVVSCRPQSGGAS